MLMMVFTGPVFGQVCHRSAARVMPAVRYGVRLELMVQTDAGHAHKTLSRSCLVQKRKNSVSRGAGHSAALRGPSRLGSRRLAGPVSVPRAPGRGGVAPESWSVPPMRQAALPTTTPEAPPVGLLGSGSCAPCNKSSNVELCRVYPA